MFLKFLIQSLRGKAKKRKLNCNLRWIELDCKPRFWALFQLCSDDVNQGSVVGVEDQRMVKEGF